MINFLTSKKLRKIKKISLKLANNSLDKVAILLTLISIINLTTPQIALAGIVDIAGPATLPYLSGVKEYLNVAPQDKNKLPLANLKQTPRYSLKTVVTAYNSEHQQTDSTPCLTASGFNVCDHFAQNGQVNIVATNFLNLPFGSKIRFPELFGDEFFVVEDRMNSRYNNIFDIWMNNKQAAVNFGLKTTLVEIF